MLIRFLDLLFSTLAIVALAPLLLPVMAILRFTGEGEVFYLQERIGQGGAPFRVIKFATMLKESPNLPGGYLTQRDDPRVLPVGRLLRRTKVNELPQLFNVWLGQMSLVGPRPQVRVHYDLLTPEQKGAIGQQKPGLTGLASLVFNNEEEVLRRSGQEFEAFHGGVIIPFKGELERWHAAHGSLAAYFKILALTAVALVRPDADYLRFFPEAPRPGPELGEALQMR